jgi:hypothetical protein
MNKINNHGDLILYPVESAKVPKSAKSSKLHILQDSNATGNRHEVISKKSPIFRWTKDGIEYIFCKEDYIIRHIGGDCEHGEQKVEKGVRKVLHELEHDPWKNELRVVID